MKTKKIVKKKVDLNKTKRIQKAGIRIINNNVSRDEAFKFFIENSTFSYYNRGFFGVLILATLKDNIQSPYRHIRTNSIAYVKKLLLKFFELKPNIDPYIKYITSTDIQREIKVQQTIYTLSIKNIDTLLEPICPSIVYSHSNPLKQNYKQSFYNIINQYIKYNRQIDEVFQNDVAFFAMEFMENYSPLSKYLDTYSESQYIDKALYTLDKMHMLGFMHNDFHDNNILLIEKYNYFNLKKGLEDSRAIIIDFGLANQIEAPKKNDEKYRLKLLQNETDHAFQTSFLIFNRLDEEHKKVQNKYIEIFERYYKCDIYKIINSYKIYIGGNMSFIPKSKFKPIRHSRKYKYTNINKKEKEDYEEDTEEYLKCVNPEKYYELINSINETLEQEKKTSGYLNLLFESQFNGLIDPAFKLPIDDDPNKLRLIMDMDN